MTGLINIDTSEQNKICQHLCETHLYFEIHRSLSGILKYIKTCPQGTSKLFEATFASLYFPHLLHLFHLQTYNKYVILTT